MDFSNTSSDDNEEITSKKDREPMIDADASELFSPHCIPTETIEVDSRTFIYKHSSNFGGDDTGDDDLDFE